MVYSYTGSALRASPGGGHRLIAARVVVQPAGRARGSDRARSEHGCQTVRPSGAAGRRATTGCSCSTTREALRTARAVTEGWHIEAEPTARGAAARPPRATGRTGPREASEPGTTATCGSWDPCSVRPLTASAASGARRGPRGSARSRTPSRDASQLRARISSGFLAGRRPAFARPQPRRRATSLIPSVDVAARVSRACRWPVAERHALVSKASRWGRWPTPVGGLVGRVLRRAASRRQASCTRSRGRRVEFERAQADRERLSSGEGVPCGPVEAIRSSVIRIAPNPESFVPIPVVLSRRRRGGLVAIHRARARTRPFAHLGHQHLWPHSRSSAAVSEA